jgi:hypothetical protein
VQIPVAEHEGAGRNFLPLAQTPPFVC